MSYVVYWFGMISNPLADGKSEIVFQSEVVLIPQ